MGEQRRVEGEHRGSREGAEKAQTGNKGGAEEGIKGTEWE